MIKEYKKKLKLEYQKKRHVYNNAFWLVLVSFIYLSLRGNFYIVNLTSSAKYIILGLFGLFIFFFKDQFNNKDIKKTFNQKSISIVLLIALIFVDPNIFKVKDILLAYLEYCIRIFSLLLLIIYYLSFNFLKKYKITLLYIFILSSLSIISLSIYDDLWPYFSRWAFNGLIFLFDFFKLNYSVEASSFLVRLKGFYVGVGAACSGLTSLSTYYIMIWFFVFSAQSLNLAINKKKLLFYLLSGTVILYLLNILRIFLILLVGAYISQEIAIGIFHSTIGSFFFVIFLFIYVKYISKKMLK